MTTPGPITGILCEADVRTDLDRLQGAWVSVSGRRHAELLIAGQLFTVRFRDGDIYMGRFELDTQSRPAHMDMRIDEGPARHKWQTTLCIYELDGPTLRWATTEPGQRGRLTAFPAEDDPHCLCLLFQREEPVEE